MNTSVIGGGVAATLAGGLGIKYNKENAIKQYEKRRHSQSQSKNMTSS